jgi:hypothetical protein
MIYKTITLLIIAASILLTGLPASFAAGADASTATSEIRTFEGLLVVREADGVFLVRSDDGAKKRFIYNANTAITRNGQPASYGDLRSRDHIRVQYNSNFVVTAIQASGS